MITRAFRPGGGARCGIATRCLILLGWLCSATTVAAAVQITAIEPREGWPILRAEAINNNGLIAVTGEGVDGLSKPVLYSSGVVQTIALHGAAQDINDAGNMVGFAISPPPFRAFKHLAGQTSFVGPPGGVLSVATGINNLNHVTGFLASPPGYEQRAFIERSGQMLLLPTLGGAWGAGYAINDLDVVVGASALGNGRSHAFVYRDGVMHDIDPDPLRNSYAQAINNRGQVAGTVVNAAGVGEVFIYSEGTMTLLGTLPGAEKTQVEAISASGQIVGTVTRPSGVAEGPYRLYPLSRAFFWSESTGLLDMNQLLPPQSGWELETAMDINDRGDIVGEGRLNGQSKSFILTGVSPVPEPTVLASMLCGCALLLVTARRRRTVRP